MNLKDIFEVITPENIKDIPLLQTAMEIFIENLEENAQISQDIKQIYENEFVDSDSESLQDSKKIIRQALLDTYVTALYNTLTKAQSNPAIKAKLAVAKSNDENYPFLNDIDSILNQEYFVTNKSVKQKKGTSVGIEYTYNLVKYLESTTNSNDFNLTEVKPFHFRTDGSIYREMYEGIVKPLSHPLGFTYAYSQIVQESISDLFGIELTYLLGSIEIRSLEGTFDVFTADADDTNVKANFLTRQNPVTGALFTEKTYNEQVTVWTNKVVENFTDETEENKNKRTILFTDGTYIEQVTNPIELLYQNYQDFLDGSTEQIKEFSGHYSLFVEYESDIVFQYQDEIDQFLATLNITDIKEENQGNAGDQFYSTSALENSFHVGGDVYSFAPGLDESTGYYNDSASINSEISDKFTVSITGSVDSSLYGGIVQVKLKDMFGNEKTIDNVLLNNGDFECSFNTYDLECTYYKIEASVTQNNIEYRHEITTYGLNEFDRTFEFTEVEDNNHVSADTLRIAGNSPINTQIFFTLTDSNGDIVTGDTTSNGSGVWETTLPLATLVSGDFTIEAKTYLPNGKLDINQYFIGTDLRIYRDDVKIKVNTFDYVNGTPDYTGLLDSTLIASTDDMLGNDSVGPLIIHQIGELKVDDTFAPADLKISDYLSSFGIELSELPEDLLLDGAYINGNDYDTSNATELQLEETFINFDRELFPIDTSDYIITTSDNDVREDFLIFGFSTTGYYLYTNEPSESDFYLYSSDTFYLTTLGDEA